MAITAVTSQEGGASAQATSVSRAFGSNVTAGNIIIVTGMLYALNGATITAGTCTKSAGTATIGAVTLDNDANIFVGGSAYIYSAIWSCQVTGSGSCTMQLSNAALTAVDIGTGEYTSGVGAIGLDFAQVNAGTGSNTSPDSGSVTTTRNGIIIGSVTTGSLGAPVSIALDAAFTLIYEEENGAAFIPGSCGRRIVTGSVSDNASWTLGTSLDWAATIAAYVEPEGAEETITLDKWQHKIPDLSRRKRGMVPSGTTGIKS